MKRRVILAMSGGVDSTLAAHLLRQDGWDVIGVTLDLRLGGDGDCVLAVDARRACKALGIEHHVLDCRNEFKRVVVAEFCNEYLHGRTPNPCVRCNPRIKFSHLMKMASQLNAEAVATGHYARVEVPDSHATADNRAGLDESRHWLRRGADRSKDQSYVLHGLTQEQLARCVFPIGAWEKPAVRALALELGIPVHDRPDSQEICFLPEGDYGRFLAETAPDRIRPGRIVNTSGEFLGRHRGIHLFTLGQRRKLGIAIGRPQYVVRIEQGTATVVVGEVEETFRSACIVRDINWITFAEPPKNVDARVQIRYTHCAAPAQIEPQGDGRTARVTFAAPESSITPGQAAVFYADDLVLGGGTIEEVL